LSSSPSPPHYHHHRRSILTTKLPILLAAASSSTFILPLRRPAYGLTPLDASRDYDSYATNYNKLDGGSLASTLGINNARKALLGNSAIVKGKVLEIGAGTGINLDYYNFEDNTIESLTLVDISEGMLNVAKAKWEERLLSTSTTATTVIVGEEEKSQQMKLIPTTVVNFIKADVTTELISTFTPNTYDVIIDTFSLCTMGTIGAQQALHQMTQVVKPNGYILLMENTRSSTNALLGMYQDSTASMAATLGGKGCVYNQNVKQMIGTIDELVIVQEISFLSGLFASFICQKKKLREEN
jgi:ubiquinone/menaquinone biosynthesis C-methylase UbiE